MEIVLLIMLSLECSSILYETLLLCLLPRVWERDICKSILNSIGSFQITSAIKSYSWFLWMSYLFLLIAVQYGDNWWQYEKKSCPWDLTQKLSPKTFQNLVGGHFQTWLGYMTRTLQGKKLRKWNLNLTQDKHEKHDIDMGPFFF